MLKNGKFAAALTTGALAVGLMGAAPSLAAEQPAPAPAPGPSAAAAHVKGRVIARTGINIRARANTQSRVLGAFRHGAIIKLSCKVRGERVNGNNIWYRLAGRSGFVSARYVVNLAPVKFCR
ncbi:SH3 domain-containing protein [Streptomyces gobiensis]|uniref:SH3 domain-containing protein n=1 Tax=Streptomyces gobiensis TaxID=2875706 RepID=UPI001E3B9DDD|nr:SH3 domain-containing protein [Streptomyces gobiensis]UGY92437.1 SH3 domain-containing protein [Streptomyces gobiensis]